MGRLVGGANAMRALFVATLLTTLAAIIITVQTTHVQGTTACPWSDCRSADAE